MPKRNSIKWNNNQSKKLEKAVKNFNAKLSRVTKKNPNISEFLPSKVKLKEIKSRISNSQDLNREINSLKRFSRKNAENIKTYESGLTLTNYEVKEAKIKTRIVNANRSREIKEKGYSEKAGNMGMIDANNLKPKNFSTNKSEKEWDFFTKSLEKEIQSSFKDEQLVQYQNNYLKGLRDHLDYENNELYKKLSKLNPKQFYDISASNPLLSIKFLYDPLEAEAILEAITELWETLI